MLTLNKINKKAGTFALHDISLEVDKGDYFILAGESGAGKTMILEIICGLVKPDSGEVIINGTDMANIPVQNRKTGLVYQDRTLFPHLNVFENIAYPLKCKKLSKKEIDNKVNELAKDTEITHLLKRKTIKLSGGEAQRVAIARTLATEPEILLLDEPLSFLDMRLKNEITRLLKEISLKGQTIIHVTHDFNEVLTLANKIAIIENGRVIQSGTLNEVTDRPASEFVAGFVGVKRF